MHQHQLALHKPLLAETLRQSNQGTYSAYVVYLNDDRLLKTLQLASAFFPSGDGKPRLVALKPTTQRGAYANRIGLNVKNGLAPIA